ncbi:hypothetical protein RUM44_012463 [Polyplax serrata]|uniref:Triokinase/FMN cyclase n=1 Tax=Polyplax serrata TaxID=468196 RepID=A0ABR1BBE2_POLSC
MADKYLVNSADDCVADCLYGFSKINPNLFVDLRNRVVFDSNSANGNEVALVTGGGSGHEPFPTGYVGEGMLTASVSGGVFSSPPSKSIFNAIRLVSSKAKEILLIVPNYTGDVLNFGLAAEMAAAEGIEVESVVIGEDIAQETQGIVTKAGRRGTCALVLAVKLAGYLSHKRKNAKETKSLISSMMQSTATLGLCVSACTKPGTGVLFHLGNDEIELGVGVHGEAGVKRMKLLSAKEAVRELVSHLTGYLSLRENDEVVVVLNNLGSLTRIEEYLLAGETEKQLTERKIKILRFYVGSFFSSLNMTGVQICLSKINDDTKDVILNALDHPTRAPAWVHKNVSKTTPDSVVEITKQPETQAHVGKLPKVPEKVEIFLVAAVTNLSRCLLDAEVLLNQLDSTCGDGDCGSTFKCLANAILSKSREKTLTFSHPPTLFSQLSSIVQEAAGGTTGALYGLFLRGVSSHLKTFTEFTDSTVVASSWRAGVDTIKKYSTARLGDRTMLDSLEVGSIVFNAKLLHSPGRTLEAFRAAVEASKEACEKTKDMPASAGRASYADPSKLNQVDAGARAVTVWLSAILKTAEETFYRR